MTLVSLQRIAFVAREVSGPSSGSSTGRYSSGQSARVKVDAA